MVKYLNIKLSVQELYLFSLVQETPILSNIYSQLTQNDALPLTRNRLNNFIKNINNGNIANNTDTNQYVNQTKGIYLFEDFYNLNLNTENIICKISLGQKIEYLNKNYPFVVNPYEVEEKDEFLSNNIGKVVTENNKLLINYGNIINNIIYFTKAEMY